MQFNSRESYNLRESYMEALRDIVDEGDDCLFGCICDGTPGKYGWENMPGIVGNGNLVCYTCGSTLEDYTNSLLAGTSSAPEQIRTKLQEKRLSQLEESVQAAISRFHTIVVEYTYTSPLPPKGYAHLGVVTRVCSHVADSAAFFETHPEANRLDFLAGLVPRGTNNKGEGVYATRYRCSIVTRLFSEHIAEWEAIDKARVKEYDDEMTSLESSILSELL